MASRPDELPDSLVLGAFQGIRNTVAPERLQPGDLERALNIDIDDAGQVRRRRGFTQVDSGDFHSLVTLNNQMYGVKNGELGTIGSDYTFTALTTVGADRLSYAAVGTTVYFSSLTASGKIVDGAVQDWGQQGGDGQWVSPVIAPTETLGAIDGKLLGSPPMASEIEHYKGRIYLANDKWVWATELYLYDLVDKTRNFLPFEHKVTLLAAVQDGLYVGTEGGLYFLRGTFAEGLVRTQVSDTPVVRGSVTRVPAAKVHPQNQQGPVPEGEALMLLTRDGICAAFDGGTVFNLTQDRMVFPDATSAAAMYREQDGINQYVAVADRAGGSNSRARIGDYVEVEIVRAVSSDLAPAPTIAAAVATASAASTGVASTFTPETGDILATDVTLVESNFNEDDWLRTAGIPGDNGSDPVGAFRLTANATHFAKVDPVVYPGQANTPHIHMFWGNPTTDANSTYESLRLAGVGSTEGGPLNRTAKWAPALLTGSGEAVIPDYITEYYKQLPSLSSDFYINGTSEQRALLEQYTPWIQDEAGNYTGARAQSVPLPAGLRYVAPGAQYIRIDPEGVETKSYTMSDIITQLQLGDTFMISMVTPDAWDGARVDTSDHISHMTKKTWDGNLGRHWLPESHPYLVPGIQVKLAFTITSEVGDPSQLHMASDMMEPGDMMHFDYFEAWSRPIIQRWHTACIDGHLNSISGILGDGQGLIRPPSFTFSITNNVIALDANSEARMIDVDGTPLIV